MVLDFESATRLPFHLKHRGAVQANKKRDNETGTQEPRSSNQTLAGAAPTGKTLLVHEEGGSKGTHRKIKKWQSIGATRQTNCETGRGLPRLVFTLFFL